MAADQPVMRLEQAAHPSGPLPSLPRLSLPSSLQPGLPGAHASYGGAAQTRSGKLLAGLRGTVMGVTARGTVVIESQVAIVSGALGVGRQVAGPLIMWQAPGAPSERPYIPSGAILVVPGPLNLAMLRQAFYSEIAGIVASSASSRDLESFLRADLITLLGSANPGLFLPHLPRLTVLLTEGLGTVAMPVRTINLLSKYQGTTALLAGITSLRARRYPELAISLPPAEVKPGWRPTLPNMELRPGAVVRVCSGSYEGSLGEINYLFASGQTFPSGIRARAARVRLEDGSLLVAPLQVLERIA